MNWDKEWKESFWGDIISTSYMGFGLVMGVLETWLAEDMSISIEVINQRACMGSNILLLLGTEVHKIK